MSKKNDKPVNVMSNLEFIDRFGGDIRVLSKEESIATNEVNYKLLVANKEVSLSLSDINTSKSVMKLAKFGLEIFEEDSDDVLAYLKSKIRNGDYPTEKVTISIGYVNGLWINPYSPGIKVANDDPGFKKYYNSFAMEGDLDVWNEKVLQNYIGSPACMFYLIAAIASITLQHLQLKPFIVDLNAETSTGKTTLTEAAISIFGKEEFLTNWDATSYGIEKKAAFANNFPLFFDDTKKADKKRMQENIYNYSSGETKTRGNGKQLQESFLWCNILLSTGEYSILELTKEAGGAAARCISLEFDKEYMNKKDFEEFKKGYKHNYGIAGYEFLNKWIYATEENKEFKKDRHLEISIRLTQNVTNNVLSRLADSFASVILTAELLYEWFDFKIDTEQFYLLFNKMCEANQEVNMPKKILMDILIEIDAKRDYIGKYNGNYYVTKNELCFTSHFLKQKIGLQDKVVRKQWLKQGLVNKQLNSKGDIIEYKRGYAKVSGEIVHPTVVTMNLSLIEELGFSL